MIKRPLLSLLFFVAVALLGQTKLLGQEPAPSAENTTAQAVRKGMLIRLTLPITEQTNRRVRRFVTQVMEQARAERIRPVIVIELYVPPVREDKGRGSVYGTSLELARFLSGDALAGATTVAYIPQPIEGHAVLVAAACDRIILGPKATIGAAGVDETQIDPFLLAGYEEIASRRKTIPTEIAMAMLDPSRKLMEVTTELGNEFVTPEGLEKLKEKRSVTNPKVLVPAGEPAVFTADQGRRLGFVAQIAPDVRGVARAMELPPESLKETFLPPESLRAVRVNLIGVLNAPKIDQARRSIENAIKKDAANFICLWIDSPGGSPIYSLNFANDLVNLPSDQIHVVAYIPEQARADAALIALAADEIVLGPGAIFGGSGDYNPSQTEIDQISKTIRDSLSVAKNRTWSLPAAIIDKELVVYRCTRLGVDEFFSDEELEKQADTDQWKKGAPVTNGSEFQVVGEQAVDFRLADKTVDSFDAFKAEFGLENDPDLVEPSWADQLIEGLASPWIAMLLMMIGGAGIFAELHAPGTAVGGFIALVAFSLFFWSQFLGGTAEWLEAILFLIGIGCLAMEFFVIPGFGIFGLGGGVLIIASVVLACQTFILPRNTYQFEQLQNSLLVLAGSSIGIVIAATFINRWLPKVPLVGGIMLSPPTEEEQDLIEHNESLVDYEWLVGAAGTTTTRLAPSGKARFQNNQIVDVIAEGQMLASGTPVVVTEVHGNRVLVEPVGQGLP